MTHTSAPDVLLSETEPAIEASSVESVVTESPDVRSNSPPEVEKPLGEPAKSPTKSPPWRLRLALLLTVATVALGTSRAILPDSQFASLIGQKGLLILQAACCFPVVFVCGWPIFVRAWRTVRTRRPDMFTLAALGSGAAFTFSSVVLVYALLGIELEGNPIVEGSMTRDAGRNIKAIAPFEAGAIEPFFEAAAVMMALMLLGLALEERAGTRTGESIRKLIRLAPKSARVLSLDRNVEDRPIEQVRTGDLVEVHPGERIPVDGIVREGSTTVDESVLTGEAMRSAKSMGMFVMAGTENGLGKIIVEALKVNEQTALAHVITLVGRAQKSRAPIQRTTDRIAAALLPFAVLAACGTFGLWVYFGPPESRTLAGVCAIGVLMASCPVALGLAAPTAVVAGMARSARAGILFRDGAALERMADIDTVLFDKTGTLTEGQMKLVGVEANNWISVEQVLSMAAAIERGSLHPIGLAIVWEAARRGVSIPPAEMVEEVPGKGVRGQVEGRRVIVGKLGFLQESGAHKDPMLSAAHTHRARGNGVIFIGVDDRCVGVIVLNDAIRPGVKAAIDGLRAMGVRPILVTGDHADTANAVARSMGIEEVVADTLPAEKYAIVLARKNQGKVVAMCGDGVNDAPALAAADVGIALGSGTEIAVSTAGVTLVRPDLRLLLDARRLSQSTVSTIRRNLILVFVYTTLAIPIAGGILFPFGGGLVSPVWQAAGIAITSLVVLANSRFVGRST